MSPPTQQLQQNPDILTTKCSLCQQTLPCLQMEYVKHIQIYHPDLADFKYLKCRKCGLQLHSLSDLCNHLTLTMVSMTILVPRFMESHETDQLILMIHA